jgi:hypothetical protein
MYRESDRLIIKGKVWNLFQNRIVVTDYDNSFCLYDLAAKGHRSWETSIEIQAIFNIGFIKDTSLYINDGSSSSYVLNVLNGQIEKKLNLSVNDSLGDLGLIGIMRDGKYCVGCVQLNEPEKIIWSVSPNPFFEVFDSNYLLGFPKPGEYGKNSSIFGRYSADTGALLWHFDVTEPGRYREWYPEGPEHPGVVTKFLGVWQGRLYVAVSNGLIIELDLENGRLLRSWQQLPDGIALPPSGWDKLHGLELAFLDAAAGEIACVTHQYYWHIDLESGALHFHDLREHFSAAQLQVSPPAGDPAFDAEHIYFASEFLQYDGQSGANVYQLAALHRRSARIVWQQQVELPQSCQWKQHPVLDGRRLYALSHDLARSSEGGTLHIFERTE